MIIAVAILVAGSLSTFFSRSTPVRVEVPPVEVRTVALRSHNIHADLDTDHEPYREIRIKYMNGTEVTLEAGKGDLLHYRRLNPITGPSFVVIHLVGDNDSSNDAQDRMLIPYATVLSKNGKKESPSLADKPPVAPK